MLRLSSASGSSAVEVIFALAVLMLLTLGAIEVSLVVYARNVVMASAHEGARAAVELGTKPSHATQVATATVKRSAGGLVDDLSVGVALVDTKGRSVARVHVSGELKAIGPVPVRIPVAGIARASRAKFGP